MAINNLLLSDKVLIKKNKDKSLFIQKAFGEKSKTDYVLDLIEAYYLMEKGKLELEDKQGKTIELDELLKVGEKKIQDFYKKYLVYSDLRERGFVVKTGFKFGFDLRVYPKGKKPGEEHTQWVISVKGQNDKINFIELSRKVRLSANIKTKLMFAVVDSENDINYYECIRITP
ncbi:MAG: tRNA-intron lyase [Candidatus Diapherotrites archaeon CG10_big_fil_rev_8_21_14_0_10_31_34]|nr:MAG: tRNA-intron lyase [Candidatus Diapherotrites archaeon CG10_big_fil_rev_8_21_14_0_10_31_34]PJA18938.1 MAG: tRNA-intron lyase [Candidatus Diapherotrites archaeon CG_4_10_14_0_2_um_filter_31_5]